MAMSVVYTTFCGEIVHEVRNGVEHYYVPDTNGNTVQLLDAAGNKTDEWTYWPFGEVRTRTGTTATPFTFGGVLGYYLDMLGNRMYVRARYLRQALARWQTVDPLWPSEPSYCYVDNRPVATSDPSGLCCQSCPGAEACNLADKTADDIYANCQIIAGGVVAAFLVLCSLSCATSSAGVVACQRACAFASVALLTILLLACFVHRQLLYALNVNVQCIYALNLARQGFKLGKDCNRCCNVGAQS